MNLIGNAMWDKYKAIIGVDAHDTFSQMSITWRHSLGGLDYHGEDNLNENFEDIDLKILGIFNSYRTWPVDRFTDAGVSDQENMVMQLSRKYLEDNNWLDANGNFIYDQSSDRFIHMGIKYKAAGDTVVSQAFDDPLHVYIILLREELITGTD